MNMPPVRRRALYTLLFLGPVTVWAQDMPDLSAPPVQLAADTATQPPPRFDITPTISPEQRPQAQATEPAPKQPLSMTADELLTQPQLLHRALSSSVALENTEGVRLLLPLYRRLPENQRQDKLLTDLAQALLARADGQAGKAVKHYRRVLEQEAQLPKIRFRYAQSLYEDHQNSEAAEQFEQIRSDATTPPSVQEVGAQYLDAIKQRQKAKLYAGGNYTRDSNINNVPKQRVIETANGRWTLNPPESAQGIAYRAGAEKDLPIKGNHRVRAGVELSGKYYWDNRSYDDLRVRVYGGGAYRSARAEAAVLPYYDRRWYGGSRYSAERGIRSEASYWLTPKHQLLAAAEAGREAYDRRRFLNGRVANLSATWLYVPASKQYFTLGLDVSRKKARDGSDAYRRRAVRATWARSWGKGFETTLTADIGLRQYDGGDLFNIVRKDREYTATATVWNKNLKLWGITPRLVGVFHRNKSNHFMYDYRKAYGFIQLNKAV